MPSVIRFSQTILAKNSPKVKDMDYLLLAAAEASSAKASENVRVPYTELQ